MIAVDIYSDVVCPWCYIGKRRWERALDQLRALHGDAVTDQIQVVFRPFQLDPGAPRTPTPVVAAYAQKFGGPDRAAAIIGNVTRVAADDGLAFRMDLAQRANTRDAHRLISFALSHGLQAAMKERLMQAYFTEGLDVGSIDVLVDLAAEVGLEPLAVRELLSSDAGLEDLERSLAESREIGVSAVPTYVFNGEFAVPGAQDPEVFVRVVSKLLGLGGQTAPTRTP